LINVKGDVKIAGNLEKFAVGQSTTSGSTQMTEKDTFDNFPVSFQITFNNEGSTHLKPTGKIELLDENNEVLKGIGRAILSSDQGAYLGEKIVDYLPVNSAGGNVLPKSKRLYDIKWEGFGYSILNEKDGTKEVKFKGLTDYYASKAAESSKYLQFWQSIHTRNVHRPLTANLTLSFEGKDRVKQDFHQTKKITVVYDEQYV